MAWGLSLACPAIPEPVWLALINAVVNGSITVDHIQDFIKAHNIRTFPDDPYPSGVNGQSNPTPGEDLAPGTTNTNLIL